MTNSLACPVHGSERQTDYGIRSGYRLKRCRDCGVVCLDVVPEDVDLRFYEDTTNQNARQSNRDAIEYWSFPQYYNKHRDVFEGFFKERLGHIMTGNPRVQSLLDIGCGYGFFVDYARRSIPRVVGIDLNAEVVEVARAAGLPVSCRAAESLIGEETYDCIVLCDVLEHLRQPVDILSMCYALLNPGGVLYVQVPNLVGFRLPYGHSWGLPHHLWQFSPHSLAVFLEAAGFRCLSHKTGVLGVIGEFERGGPSLTTRLQWFLGRRFGCGNRLQWLAAKD